jgi:hypothetical protein
MDAAGAPIERQAPRLCKRVRHFLLRPTHAASRAHLARPMPACVQRAPHASVMRRAAWARVEKAMAPGDVDGALCARRLRSMRHTQPAGRRARSALGRAHTNGLPQHHLTAASVMVLRRRGRRENSRCTAPQSTMLRHATLHASPTVGASRYPTPLSCPLPSPHPRCNHAIAASCLR